MVKRLPSVSHGTWTVVFQSVIIVNTLWTFQVVAYFTYEVNVRSGKGKKYDLKLFG